MAQTGRGTVILNPFFRVKDPGISSYPGGPRCGQPPDKPGAAAPRLLSTIKRVLHREERVQDDSALERA